MTWEFEKELTQDLRRIRNKDLPFPLGLASGLYTAKILAREQLTTIYVSPYGDIGEKYSPAYHSSKYRVTPSGQVDRRGPPCPAWRPLHATRKEARAAAQAKPIKLHDIRRMKPEEYVWGVWGQSRETNHLFRFLLHTGRIRPAMAFGWLDLDGRDLDFMTHWAE